MESSVPDKNGALEALVSDLKLWACSPRVPLKAQLVMLEAIGRLAVANSILSPSSTADAITANPERRSSQGHSEIKPDGSEGRSGEVDSEGGGSGSITRSDAVDAGRAECGSRQAGREADQEGLTPDGGDESFVPSATLAHDLLHERKALIRECVGMSADDVAKHWLKKWDAWEKRATDYVEQTPYVQESR